MTTYKVTATTTAGELTKFVNATSGEEALNLADFPVTDTLIYSHAREAEITFNNTVKGGGFYFGIPSQGVDCFATAHGRKLADLNAILDLLPAFLADTYPATSKCEIREMYWLDYPDQYGNTVFVCVNYANHWLTEIAVSPDHKLTVYMD